MWTVTILWEPFRSAGLLFEGLASGTIAASAVLNGDVVSFALEIIIVLTVTGFAADFGCRACGGLVHAVGCAAIGAIRAAGSFAAG